MTFEQIDCFIAAVHADTFFDAAELLHTTQSTLSKQIQKLEKELNLQLFDRSRRNAVLTPAGELFYREAQELSRQYHQLLHRMALYQTTQTQQLSVGTLPILSQYHLTGSFRLFQKEHPEIPLTLTEAEETELIEGIEKERFSMILARESLIDMKHYHFFPIATDRICVMLPEDHPLATCKALSVNELKTQSFLLMHPYTTIYQLCMQIFQNAGVHPSILRTARVESLISAVAVKEGISLFAESNFHLFQHEGVVSVPLKESPVLRIGFAYKKTGEYTPAMDCFLHFFADSKKYFCDRI